MSPADRGFKLLGLRHLHSHFELQFRLLNFISTTTFHYEFKFQLKDGSRYHWQSTTCSFKQKIIEITIL